LVVAEQLFTTVKRGNAIAQKQLKNGSSNHGEPFFLGSPTPSLPRGEGEKRVDKK
jgi:hypothetical protein